MNKDAAFYYFLGTGNTQTLVDYVVRRLISQGHHVSLKRIENGYEPDSAAADLWLAFPVNSQAVSPFIWRFMQSLPRSEGTKVYVITTLNNSAYVLQPLYNLLKTKGYVPASACELSMPNNMLESEACNDLDQRLFAAAYHTIDHWIRQTMAGEGSWSSQYKGSKFVSFLSRRTVLPWMSMRVMLKLRTNPTKCTTCGLCARQCPVGNITMMDQFPVHGSKCEFCMKCAANCPKKAIYVSGKPKIHFRNARMSQTTIHS